MSSPYVRRLRLGTELRALRDEHNLTQARVARMIGKTRTDISRLENGQSVDLADVLNILEAVRVDDERWTALSTIAHDATATGWWDSVKHMGIVRRYMPTWNPVRLPSAPMSRQPSLDCCRFLITCER